MKLIIYLTFYISFASAITNEEYETIRDLIFTIVRQDYNPRNFATLMRAGKSENYKIN